MLSYCLNLSLNRIAKYTIRLGKGICGPNHDTWVFVQNTMLAWKVPSMISPNGPIARYFISFVLLFVLIVESTIFTSFLNFKIILFFSILGWTSSSFAI